MPRSKPILITLAVFTSLYSMLTTLAGINVLDPVVLAIAMGVVTAGRAGIDFYLAGSSTESAQVLAVQPVKGGHVIAGPASSFTTGAAIEPQLPVGEITTPPERSVTAE
jgi:hypothetical protein